MKIVKDSYNYLIVLKKGEKLMESILSLAKKENIKTGWISGIGACSNAEIGLYNPKTKDYEWKTYDQQLEILNLQGDISLDDEGEPMLHLHGTFSDENFNSIGGHIKELQILPTCEIFLHSWFSEPIARKFDDDTKLKLLDL